MALLILGIDAKILEVVLRDKIDAVIALPASHVSVFRRTSRVATVTIANSLTSVEDVLSAVHRTGRIGEIDGVYTRDEFALVTAASTAKALGAEGLDPMIALRFRDKSLQKSVLRAGGIPVANWKVLSNASDSEIEEEIDSFGYPSIVKPVSGGGARWTWPIKGREDAREAVRRLVERGPLSGHPMMIERLIVGKECHVDGHIADGNLRAVGVGEDLENVISFLNGGIVGSIMCDPVRQADLFSQCREFALKSLSILGLNDGVFHMEVFRTLEGLVFGECAAREPGGLICEAFRDKYGYDLVRAAVGRASRNRFDRELTRPEVSVHGVGWEVLRPAGRSDAPRSAADLLRQPGVFLARNADERVGRHWDGEEGSIDKGVLIAVRASDEDEVRDLLMSERLRFAAGSEESGPSAR